MTDKLESLDIVNQVVAVVADTPTVNFGHEEGSVYLIARNLGRQLLFIECQHHTEELVPKAVMVQVSGRPSTSPADALFTRWQTAFPNLQVQLQLEHNSAGTVRLSTWQVHNHVVQ